MRITRQKFIAVLLVTAALIYVTNSSRLASKRDGAPLLLAHRGLAQAFHMEGITNDTCTAERIYPPEYPYLENTIASIDAAFSEGADIVEFDIQPTKDNRFVVFHDWTLDCRTNGTGVTRDHTAAELQALDIGYGYTADGGKTFPFRGKGVQQMPTLDDVLGTFPDRSFLIHIKSNDANEGAQLAQYLQALPTNRLEQLTVYGGDQPVAAVKEQLPKLRTMSKASLVRSLLAYEALGWTGFVPSSMEHSQIHIPEKFAPWLWGWPNRFLDRMDKADTRVILVGGDGSEFSRGFDTPEDVQQRLPVDYTGGIWTNRIDLIAPIYRGK